MSQTNPVIGSGLSGLEYRNQDNNAKQAILSCNKGSSIPSYAVAGCIWLDDSATPWVFKIYDGSDWIKIAEVNATTNIADAVGISGRTADVAVQDDYIPFSDTSDSGKLKKVLLGNILDVFTWRSNSYLRSQNFTQTSLTDATSIAWDADANQVASITLAGNRTLANPTNLKAGATYILIVKQDATGSRTLAYGSSYKWASGTAPTLSTAASAVDILTFVSDGTYLYGTAQKAFA